MISRSDIEMSFFSFLFYGINIRGVSILYKKKIVKLEWKLIDPFN